MHIRQANAADYSTLIAIWEASVRATHDFLPESEISSLKPLILNQYFDAVQLTVADIEGKAVGFSGVAEHKLEMLFISPNHRGQGIGRQLCKHAIHHLGVIELDVNEQNPQAVGFYQKMGFHITGRSERDGQGKPYPLLHMTYPN